MSDLTLLFAVYEQGSRFVAARGEAIERYLADPDEPDVAASLAEQLGNRLRAEGLGEPGASWGLWLWRDEAADEADYWESAFRQSGVLGRAAPEDLESLLGSNFSTEVVLTKESPDRAFVIQPEQIERAPLVVGFARKGWSHPPETYSEALEDTFAFVEAPSLSPGLWVWQGRVQDLAELEFDDPDELFWPMRDKYGRLDKQLELINGHAGSFRRPTRDELTELVELPFVETTTATPASGAPAFEQLSDRALQEAAREGEQAQARRERRGQLAYAIISLVVMIAGLIWLIWSTCG